jgi:hypothetical protein
MFRATNSPILRSTLDCIYSFWYNPPTLVPTGAMAEMEFHFNCVTCRQQCLCIVPNQPYMFRATNSPILRNTLDCIYSFWCNAPTLADRCHGWDGVPPQLCHLSAAMSVHCIKRYIYSQECSWGRANLSPETCRADLKRLINGKVVESCWLLTSLCWWCTVTQTSNYKQAFLRNTSEKSEMHLNL